jgi:hypothetical protein
MTCLGVCLAVLGALACGEPPYQVTHGAAACQEVQPLAVGGRGHGYGRDVQTVGLVDTGSGVILRASFGDVDDPRTVWPAGTPMTVVFADKQRLVLHSVANSEPFMGQHEGSHEQGGVIRIASFNVPVHVLDSPPLTPAQLQQFADVGAVLVAVPYPGMTEIRQGLASVAPVPDADIPHLQSLAVCFAESHAASGTGTASPAQPDASEAPAASTAPTNTSAPGPMCVKAAACCLAFMRSVLSAGGSKGPSAESVCNPMIEKATDATCDGIFKSFAQRASAAGHVPQACQ